MRLDVLASLPPRAHGSGRCDRRLFQGLEAALGFQTTDTSSNQNELLGFLTMRVHHVLILPPANEEGLRGGTHAGSPCRPRSSTLAVRPCAQHSPHQRSASPRAARRSSGVREAFESCEVKLRVAMALQAALLVWDLRGHAMVLPRVLEASSPQTPFLTGKVDFHQVLPTQDVGVEVAVFRDGREAGQVQEGGDFDHFPVDVLVAGPRLKQSRQQSPA